MPQRAQPLHDLRSCLRLYSYACIGEPLAQEGLQGRVAGYFGKHQGIGRFDKRRIPVQFEVSHGQIHAISTANIIRQASKKAVVAANTGMFPAGWLTS
jgi:hypothetical protein